MPDMRLEVVILPVADVDRAKTFYTDRLGFHLDVDHEPHETFRVVQVTPPGSSCSVVFGVGLEGAPSCPMRGMHLVVANMESAVAELRDRGVELLPIRHMGATGWQDGPDPGHADYATDSGFTDPDSNEWVLQEVGYRST